MLAGSGAGRGGDGDLRPKRRPGGDRRPGRAGGAGGEQVAERDLGRGLLIACRALPLVPCCAANSAEAEMTPEFANETDDARPIWLVRDSLPEGLDADARSWASASGFSGKQGQICLLPDGAGGLGGAFSITKTDSADWPAAKGALWHPRSAPVVQLDRARAF